MWLPDRRALLATGAAALLGGCGFEPIYGKDGAARRVSGQIAVADITGHLGFEMRRQLTDRLGDGAAAPFRLEVTYWTDSEALAITPEAEITRFNVAGRAEYRLVDVSGGRLVSAGKARAFAAYSANDAPISTRAAERDADLRLAAALANQIATRILVDAESWLP